MNPAYDRRTSITNTNKSKWDRLWPVIACGAGLFSDGYLNGVRNVPLECNWVLLMLLPGHWLRQHDAQDHLQD